MRINKVAPVAIFWVIPWLVGCASNPPQRYSLKLDQNASIATARPGQPAPAAGATDERRLDDVDFPVVIRKPGFADVILVRASPSPQKLEVQLKPLDVWSSDWGQAQLDNALETVTEETYAVQALFASHQTGAALKKIESLRQKYPRLQVLNFLKASCLMLMGDKQRAQTVLEEALERSPNHPEGLLLYHELTGRNYATVDVKKNSHAEINPP